MGHLAAQAATDAAIQHGGDWVVAQGIRIGFDGQGWTAGKPDTSAVAGTGRVIDAKPSAHIALAVPQPGR